MRRWAVVCGLLAMTGGCGGDDTASDPAPATVTDGDTAAADPTAPDESDAVVAIEVPPCDVVTSDDVAAATGLTVITAGEDQGLGPAGCVFDVGLSAEVFVLIDDGQGRMTSPASMFEFYMDDVDDAAAEVVPELGAAAVYSPGFRALAVDAGDGRFLAVGLSGGYPDEFAEPLQMLVTLASAAVDRL